MDELQILKDKYDAMPHGSARTWANQEAVKRADELGNQGGCSRTGTTLPLSRPFTGIRRRASCNCGVCRLLGADVF